MIAAVRTGRVGVSSGTSGIFAAARSAKNAWRSAFDSGDWTSSMKRLVAAAHGYLDLEALSSANVRVVYGTHDRPVFETE